MKKRNRMLQTIVLAFAVVLCLATGVLATEQEHVHNWVLRSGGERGHTMKCDGCGQLKFEEHTIDSSEICTVCGVYHHTHNYQCAWSDDQMHNMVCSGCGDERTTTHSKDSEGICVVCGFTPHEHTWQYRDGENYSYNHGLQCTQCAAISSEDHIYGDDGLCTVCGKGYPHEHVWRWDGNESNYLRIHFMVCSCGATTADDHYFKWDGKMGDRHGHRVVCNTCGYDAVIYEHIFNAEYFHGARCTVCGYQKPGTTVPEADLDETVPVETKPVVTEPEETVPVEKNPTEETVPEEKDPTDETIPVEKGSTETQIDNKELSGINPDETKPVQTEAEENIPINTAKEEKQHGSFAWVWVAAAIVLIGGLSAAVFFVKRKSS